MESAILFNCCTDYAAPDWSRFVNLELGGCMDDDGNTIGGMDRIDAEFFTVYGHLVEGGSEAITDWHGSYDEAVATAEELKRLSGLALVIIC